MNIQEKVLSLNELIYEIKQVINYLKSKWLIIALFVVFGGCIGFFYANYKKTLYLAKTTFIVEEAKGMASSLSGLANLAGQFGVDVAGNSSAGILSGDNILLYFRSPSLSREVLLSYSDNISGVLLADIYSEVHEFKSQWENNKKIGKINFSKEYNKTLNKRLYDSLLNSLVKNILDYQFIVSKTDKKGSLIDVIVKMENEELSKNYCEKIVQKVVERYISIKVQRQKMTVDKLQNRADSIALLLQKKTLSGASLQTLASSMDINPIYKTGTNVATETTLRDKTLLSTIFATVTQNLELAKFTLSQETPVMQIIDSPFMPLQKVKISKLKSTLIGSIISFLLIMVFFIIRKLTIVKVNQQI